MSLGTVLSIQTFDECHRRRGDLDQLSSQICGTVTLFARYRLNPSLRDLLRRLTNLLDQHGQPASRAMVLLAPLGVLPITLLRDFGQYVAHSAPSCSVGASGVAATG